MTTKLVTTIDLETSGLDYNTGAVILSMGATVDVKLKKGETEMVVDEFYALVRPTEAQWKQASPKALEVNGLTWDVLQKDGKPLPDVCEDFLRWCVDHHVARGKASLVGQNPNFDMGFLRRFMGAELDFIGFPWDDLFDVRDLYSILANRGKLPILKYRSGENIANALGVEPEPAIHNALEGAKVVRRNYAALVALGVRQ
jgi:DNA polymerase III epsilon subunit-like protein